ncbi:MAG: ABC-F family ATP-binding cassette domain-containing protein [Polyangiaceae bacterium]|nr:ABC-F family ATP-binding cassette domain-containing protein [Polyangiaceae bacterium]
MLSFQNLGKSFGARVLFEDVSLKLSPGCRYGLVGANGSGKTTLLGIIAGTEPATHGSVTMPRTTRMGVLRQDRFLRDEDPILEVAAAGDEVVWRALVEERALLASGGDPARVGELEELVRAHDGYTLEARASSVLEGLGIPVRVHRQPLGTLSGGFKLRVLLAQVLIGGPDVVLLDEPTNHLDILSIRWLEKFLAGYRGCAIVVSHDQRFLDNVATHVLDVDYGTISLYTGNYTAFAADKEAIRARKEAEIAKAEAEIAHKRAFVERFRYKATKAAQAQSRLKQIERIEVEELADTSRREPRFAFVPERPSGREVLTAEGLEKSYGTVRVLGGVSLAVRRGERLGIIGANGLGKSTLLRILVGRLAADAGRVGWGHEVRLGYFAQDHHEILGDPDKTALEVLWAVRPNEGNAFVRGHLGRVLFSRDDVNKPVRALSGGEAARLVFGCIAADRPNVLVLDEPTNHLDIEAIHALVAALVDFPGTVIFVSHDRWFVSQLATRILELTPEGHRDFPGTYAEYLERCGDDHLDVAAVVLRAKAERRADEGESGPAAGASWEEQKRRRNRQKELPLRRDKVLEAVAAAEARQRAIHERYASDGFFERTPKAELDALVREEAELPGRIDALMAEWEALESELAALKSG